MTVRSRRSRSRRDALTVTRSASGSRLLAICDLLLEETAAWIWIGGRVPDPGTWVGRQADLLERYADRLGELAGPR